MHLVTADTIHSNRTGHASFRCGREGLEAYRLCNNPRAQNTIRNVHEVGARNNMQDIFDTDRRAKLAMHRFHIIEATLLR